MNDVMYIMQLYHVVGPELEGRSGGWWCVIVTPHVLAENLQQQQQQITNLPYYHRYNLVITRTCFSSHDYPFKQWIRFYKKMRLSLVALMTGPLTLKLRFLEKKLLLNASKFWKSAISLQHFELWEISISYFVFSTYYHHKRQIFQLFRVKCLVQQNLPKIFGQSDERKF